jgi:hypothetical protein
VENIFAKSVQTISYADDVVLIARTRKDLVEIFRSLESAAVRFGLKTNENKTKYTAVNTRRLMDTPVLEIEPHASEQVRTSTIWVQYLLRIVIEQKKREVDLQ